MHFRCNDLEVLTRLLNIEKLEIVPSGLNLRFRPSSSLLNWDPAGACSSTTAGRACRRRCCSRCPWISSPSKGCRGARRPVRPPPICCRGQLLHFKIIYKQACKLKGCIRWALLHFNVLSHSVLGKHRETGQWSWESNIWQGLVFSHDKAIEEAFRCGRDDKDHIEGSYIPITYQQY